MILHNVKRIMISWGICVLGQEGQLSFGVVSIFAEFVTGNCCFLFKQMKIIAVCIKVKQLRKKQAWKKIQTWTGIEPITSVCDTNAALLPTELSRQLGAGHLWVRYIPVDGDVIWIYETHIFVLRKINFKKWRSSQYVLNLSSWGKSKPEKKNQAWTGIEPINQSINQSISHLF